MISNKLRLSLLSAAFILVLTANLDAAKRVKLELNMDKGDSYQIRMTQVQRIFQGAKDRKVDTKSSMTVMYGYDVMDVDDGGNMTVKMTCDSMRAKQDGPAGKQEFDSTKPDTHSSPFSEAFKGMLDMSFTMTLTPKGEVTDISGYDKYFERVLKNMKSSDEQRKKQVEEYIKENFGSDQMRKWMEMGFQAYPEKEVKVGQKWGKKMEVRTFFPLIMTSKFKLLKLDKKGIATISVDSDLVSDPKAKPRQIGQVSQAFDFKGRQWGTYKINTSNGFIEYSKIRHVMSGTVTIDGVQDFGNTFKIPMTMKGITEIESKPKDKAASQKKG